MCSSNYSVHFFLLYITQHILHLKTTKSNFTSKNGYYLPESANIFQF